MINPQIVLQLELLSKRLYDESRPTVTSAIKEIEASAELLELLMEFLGPVGRQEFELTLNADERETYDLYYENAPAPRRVVFADPEDEDSLEGEELEDGVDFEFLDEDGA